MRISASLAPLRQTKWHEYLLRFVFGGLVTVAAGLLAREFGARIGGLFLAFPAIFPATATLIEKHERQKKQQRGAHGTQRGRSAAAVDAAGSAIGCMGLLAFALVVWRCLPQHATWMVLGGALLAWAGTAGLGWWMVKTR